MNHHHQQGKRFTDYLLGNLQETDREEFEAAYFADTGLFIELLDAEDRLIGNYLRGKLADDEKRLFEQRYLLNPCGRENLEFASLITRPEVIESFNDLKRSDPPASPSFFQSLRMMFVPLQKPVWLAAAMALLVFALVLPGYWFFHQRRGVTETARSNDSPEVAVVPSPPSPGGETKEIATVQRVELEPRFVTRSASAVPTLSTSTGAQIVELKLKLGGRIYPNYRGLLRRMGDKDSALDSVDALKPERDKQETFVLWKLKTALTEGDYEVELTEASEGEKHPDDTLSYQLKVRER